MSEEKTDQKFGERLSTVETEIAGIRSEVRNVTAAVDRLAEHFQRRERPNWQAWIGFLGLIFLLISGGAVYVDMRIENRSGPLETKLVERLVEVETQFNADAQLRNMQFAEQQRLNAVFWNGSALGKTSAYPTQPYFFPNVSQKGESQ